MSNMSDSYCPVSVQSNYSNEERHGSTCLPMQASDGIRFFLLRQGKAIATVNRLSYILESDQCACIMPGASFSIRASNLSDVFFYDLIEIDWEFLMRMEELMRSSYFSGLMNRSASLPQIITPSAKGDRILQLLNEIALMYKAQSPQYEIGCASSACLLLYHLGIWESSSQQTAAEDQNIGKVIRYIENNYMEKISLDRLSSICCMSKYHFIRHFCEVTQQTPIEYINSFRIRVACRRLKENRDEKILSIALSAGFNDLSNFNRIFKRIIGVTPAEYRRMELERQEQEEHNVVYYASEDQAPAFYCFFP